MELVSQYTVGLHANTTPDSAVSYLNYAQAAFVALCDLFRLTNSLSFSRFILLIFIFYYYSSNCIFFCIFELYCVPTAYAAFVCYAFLIKISSLLSLFCYRLLYDARLQPKIMQTVQVQAECGLCIRTKRTCHSHSLCKRHMPSQWMHSWES